MTASLPRRVAAEAFGTAALVAVVVGSARQAAGLSQDAGVQLLANSLATVLGLGVLIALLGPVSGAHLNPVVSAASWYSARRGGEGLTGREVAAYVPAQVAGAVGGSVLADAMFAEPLVSWSTYDRSGAHLLLAEGVATAGLVLLVLGLARTGRGAQAVVAVPSFVGAAFWFTSSCGFANPAVTLGRAFTGTVAGISPASVGPFAAAQLAGAAAGIALAAALFGDAREDADPGGAESAVAEAAAVAPGGPGAAAPATT